VCGWDKDHWVEWLKISKMHELWTMFKSGWLKNACHYWVLYQCREGFFSLKINETGTL